MSSIGHVWKRRRALWAAMIALLATLPESGCSVRRYAVNKLGDALAQSGSSFASDDDPDLIKDSAPFSLKLMESLLAESPRHAGLLQATAAGFTQYAFAFVQEKADEVEAADLKAAEAARARARKLYARARGYGLRGLEVRHAGIGEALRKEPKKAALAFRKADVPLMYWTAAAWGSFIALSKDRPEVFADQSIVEALIDRALELDEAFGNGAVHSFLISYEFARQGGEGDPEARARRHFARAMEFSQGRLAGPLVALAEAVCIQKQQPKEFKQLLEQAVAIDADANPPSRLENLILQRRARWLLGRMDDLFLLEPEPSAGAK